MVIGAGDAAAWLGGIAMTASGRPATVAARTAPATLRNRSGPLSSCTRTAPFPAQLLDPHGGPPNVTRTGICSRRPPFGLVRGKLLQLFGTQPDTSSATWASVDHDLTVVHNWADTLNVCITLGSEPGPRAILRAFRRRSLCVP